MGIVILSNTDSLYFLSAQNSLFVGANATLFSSTSFATPIVESFASGRTVWIEGTILSQTANAVSLASEPESLTGNHTIIVGEAGAAYGNLNYATLVANGTNCLVQNFGLVSGGGGVFGVNWGGSTLENDGTIAGQRYAGVQLINGVGSNSIVNDGVITGTGGIVLANAGATIANSGEIRSNSATVAAVNGTAANVGFVVRNSGDILGLDDAVTGSAFVDRIVNTGTIDGDVVLNAGNDVYRGKTGTLLGELRGGAGNDTLIGGLGDDSIFGEIGNDRIGGSAGDNLLSGGAGNDIFVFGRGGGDDLVSDFTDNADDLDLSAFRFATFTAVTSRAVNVTGGLLIDFGTVGGGTVFLQGMTKAMLDSGDVLL